MKSASMVTLLMVLNCLLMSVTAYAQAESSYVIMEGIGFKLVKIHDPVERLIEVYGEPENKVKQMGSTFWQYRNNHGVDFLTIDTEGEVFQIMFNQGFNGKLKNAIGIGSSLSEVLDKYNGAKMVVDATEEETYRCEFGYDRVLYEQRKDDEIICSMFIDSKKGALFWFDNKEQLFQIVVFEPYER